MTTVERDILINDTPLSEAQRQMLLLALAVLAQRSPCFDRVLEEIAIMFQGQEIYTSFKALQEPRRPLDLKDREVCG